MAAYYSIAVMLGQIGLLKELLKIIKCMRQKPFKRISNMHHKKWDPILELDLVVYNATREHYYAPPFKLLKVL